MRKKKISCYWVYTGLFIVMCVVAFFPFMVEGKSFVWGAGVEDGLSQHFSALAYYGKWIREFIGSLLSGHPQIPMWEMSLGYGADILATLNYYAIGDPLNVLYGFVPMKYTEVMYNFMILLRMYLAGITFMLYSRKMKKRDFGIIIGALVYVFCGFCFRLGLRHPFFLNPMIYFPLLCLGIEKIYKKEKPYVFILSVCLSAASNYYFLYMLTIFAVIYAWIRFYDYEKEDRIRKFFFTVGKFILYYVWGIAMAAVILLPSVIGFLGNGRNGTGVDWRTLIIYPAKFYILLIENLVGYGNVGNNTNVCYLPIVGIVILFTLFSRRMKHRKYKLAFIACIVALAFPIFGFAFNGFSYASNRWSFTLSFIVALLTAEMYPRLFLMTMRQKIGIAAGIFVYIIFCVCVEFSGEKMLHNRGIYVAGFILIAFYLCFLWFQKKGYDSQNLLTKVVVALLMIVSIGAHGYYRFDPEQRAYTKEFMDRGTSLGTLQSKEIRLLKSVKDDSLYRVHAEGYKYKNFGLVNELNTISGYYSITPGDVADTINSYQTLGMQYADKYRGLDQRLGLMSMAGVKYLTVSQKGHIDQWTKSKGDVPYGVKKLKEQGNVTLYQNQYALPFAYAYDSYITKNQYEALNGVGREQAMLENAVLEKEMDIAGLKHEKVYNNVSVSTIPLSETRISSPKGKKYSVITVPVDADKEVYLYFKDLKYDDSQIQTDNFLLSGKKSTKGILIHQNDTEKKIYIQSTFSPYYFGRTDYMVKLNHHETNSKEQIKLNFLSRGTYQFEQLYLVTVDKKQTMNKIQNLQKNAMEDIKYEVNHFSGKIVANKKKVVCMIIPYSKGWSAKVDGKEAKIYKTNGMYMGVLVGKGEHQIELHYVTPGIKIGAMISAAAWILLAVAAVVTVRKKK